MAADTRLQSSIEYLVNYAIAILIISVTLSIFYELGFFTPAPGLPNLCQSSPGFSCGTPVLYTTGVMAVNVTATLTAARTPFVITGIACTPDSVPPTSGSFIPPSGSGNAVIMPDSNQKLYFTCPLQSGSMGSPFSGYLWITYNSPSRTGLVVELASVYAKSSATGTPTITAASTTAPSTTTATSTTTSHTTSISIKTTSTTSTVEPTSLSTTTVG